MNNSWIGVLDNSSTHRFEKKFKETGTVGNTNYTRSRTVLVEDNFKDVSVVLKLSP